jgi:hypothetical protein
MRDALVVRLPFALPPLFQQNPFTSIPAFFGELLFYHCCYYSYLFVLGNREYSHALWASQCL